MSANGGMHERAKAQSGPGEQTTQADSGTRLDWAGRFHKNPGSCSFFRGDKGSFFFFPRYVVLSLLVRGKKNVINFHTPTIHKGHQDRTLPGQRL